MLKKISCLILIVICLTSLNGCSGELRKKFVRKKKDAARKIPVFKPEDYETKFTPAQRYVNHYVFWKNAAREVIDILEKDEINNKKLKFHAMHTLDEVKDLHKLLPDEQKEQLNPYIEEFAIVADKLIDPAYVINHKNALVKKVRHHYNEVSRNFSYNAVKDYLQS